VFNFFANEEVRGEHWYAVGGYSAVVMQADVPKLLHPNRRSLSTSWTTGQ
jgi:hypothetical protein